MYCLLYAHENLTLRRPLISFGTNEERSVRLEPAVSQEYRSWNEIPFTCSLNHRLIRPWNEWREKSTAREAKL